MFKHYFLQKRIRESEIYFKTTVSVEAGTRRPHGVKKGVKDMKFAIKGTAKEIKAQLNILCKIYK